MTNDNGLCDNSDQNQQMQKATVSMMIMYLHTSPALRRPASCNMKKTTGKWQVVQRKCSPYMVIGKQVFCQVQRTIVADERTKGYHNNMPMQGVIWNIVGVFSTKHLPSSPHTPTMHRTKMIHQDLVSLKITIGTHHQTTSRWVKLQEQHVYS